MRCENAFRVIDCPLSKLSCRLVDWRACHSVAFMFRGFVFLLLLLLLSSTSQPTTVLVGNHVSRLFIAIAGRCFCWLYTKSLKSNRKRRRGGRRKQWRSCFPFFWFHGSYCLIPLFSFLFFHSSFINSHFHSSFLISLISFLLSHSSFFVPLFSFFLSFLFHHSSFFHSSVLITLFLFLFSHFSFSFLIPHSPSIEFQQVLYYISARCWWIFTEQMHSRRWSTCARRACKHTDVMATVWT